MGKSQYKGFTTKAVHEGEQPDFSKGAYGDVVMPIHLSTTFARQEVEIPTAGYEYSRSLNPTRHALEQKLASLENADYGLAMSSGLSAGAVIILSLLKSGDHIIAFDDLYGGSKRLMNKVFSEYNIEVTYVDAVNLQNVKAAIKPTSKMIWVETPTNPLLKVCDIQGLSETGRANNLLLVVDNTFLSPYFQNPLKLGADIVFHSSTKYIGGHSDVVGGAIMLNNNALYEKLQYNQNAIGAVPSPFDCYLTMRGIKTLELRMQKHMSNALSIAAYLEAHPKVSRVFYPGLKSHPQHELSLRQTNGYGGIITFLINGDVNTAKTFLESLKIFALAESLGGVESLIEHPALMTHSGLEQSEREKIGIYDNLIRVSVGIENIEDLIEDIEAAFACI